MKKLIALLLLIGAGESSAQQVTQTEFYNLVNRVNQLQQSLSPINQQQVQAQQQTLQSLLNNYNQGTFPQASSTPPLAFFAPPGTPLQPICNSIPDTFGPTDIYLSAGAYPSGCFITNKRPAPGGYIHINGAWALADAGSGLLASGAIASATGLLNGGNTWPTLTVASPAGGYADGGLRGHLIEVFNDGGTVGGIPTQISAIYDNTSTVITVAGHWANTPTNTWTFAIVDAASIFDGGVLLPYSLPSTPIAQRPAGPSFDTGPVANYAVFVFSNIGTPTSVPTNLSPANGSTNAGGSIYVSGVMATGFPGMLMAAYNSPRVTLYGSQMEGLNPSHACLNFSDNETYLAADYSSGWPGDEAFLCGPFTATGSVLEEGVVGDATLAIGAMLANGLLGGGVEDKDPWPSVHLSLSSYRGLTSSGDSVITAANGHVRLDGIKAENISGAACFSFGTEDDGIEGIGASLQVLVRAGFWNNCNSGMFGAGGYYNFQQGPGSGVTGTNTNWGMLLIHGAQVDINATGSMQATGGAGDIFNGGSPITYASMGALGIAIGLDGLTRVNEGVASTGAIIYMNNGFKVPQNQHGTDAGTGGALSVTFVPSFTKQPDCTCSGPSGFPACSPGSSITTLGATFTAPGAGTGNISFICDN